MTRTPLVILLLAAGVTLVGAADPAPNPPPEKKPAATAATAPKKESKPNAAAPKAPAAASKKAPASKPVTAARKTATAPQTSEAAPGTPAVEPGTDAAAPAGPQGAETDAKAGGDAKPKDDPNLGMSILGNQEAPKALVIVPWKSSEIGQGMGIQTLLDDSRQPIDKDVFMRVLNYFELRSTTTPTNAHQNGAKGGKS